MKTPILVAAISALTSMVVNASPTLSISTTTTSRDFPLTSQAPLTIPLVKDTYTLTISGLTGNCKADTQQKARFRTPLSLNCAKATTLPIKIRFSGDYEFVFDDIQHTLTINRATKKTTKSTFKRPIPNVKCEQYEHGPVTLFVANTFPEGTRLRDAFTNAEVTVKNQQVTITPSPSSGGLVLLAPVAPETPAPAFTYRNANIYFVMVDRFNNGDTQNDHSYGRKKDGKQEIGTFHGGDLKGIIDKLDYIASLGTNVLWLSPIVEQVHGFVGGGDSGSFPFYAYHGYWTRDFTRLDANFGNEEDLQTLVSQAHQRGIKVLLDAVINHPGYATLADLQHDHIAVSDSENLPERWTNWTPSSAQNWHDYNQLIDYNSPQWRNWWGSDWVRAKLPNYPEPGSSDTTLTLAGLPDFLTESRQFVTPPKWLLENPNTRVKARDNFAVSDYLIEWQSDWVKRFGIDGFRVDTVKHVEGEVWQRLKQSASQQLEQWRKANNKRGEPFWMMGEVWGHSAYRSPYAEQGFDALINFDLQKKLDKGAACFSQMAETYQNYADSMLQTPDHTPVSYMSSHDTELFFSRFNRYDMQRNAANALLLTPGAIQVYYGDEIGRPIGPYADDFHQGTRSDMVWQLNDQQNALLEHWKVLGQFRAKHPAVGAGKHSAIPQQHGYAFSRILGNDKVFVGFVGH
ncbi:alpha-amylase [Vibrio sp. TRT 17S01]|uniref:alpha-amylase n=1 Tax=Vibrio sp. TRT 17S01 TaxID=3418505 RepID=UPI003CF91942